MSSYLQEFCYFYIDVLDSKVIFVIICSKETSAEEKVLECELTSVQKCKIDCHVRSLKLTVSIKVKNLTEVPKDRIAA